MDSIGLWLVKTQTIGTAVSSVTVTDAFSAVYDNYLVIIGGGVGSVSAANLGLQMGSTTTNYRESASGVNTAGTSALSYFNNVNTRWLLAGASDPTGTISKIQLWNPFLALATFFESQVIRAGANTHFDTLGSLADTTSYTSFTVYASSGTLTGGTIRVYGYRN
jgi:hypothetical protein